MRTIYLAHYISGYGYDEVVKYFKNTSTELKKMGYDVLHPMTGKEYLRNEIKFKAEGYNHPLSNNHSIVERDRWMVNQSDIVYCNLVGAKLVSIGSMFEIAWARMLGKFIILSMEKENIHQHAFVIENASVVYETHEEALQLLEKMING